MTDDLELAARRIRLRVLDEIFAACKGHIGGCLSCVDILVALYHGGIIRRGKDHFIMGKGHAATALYAVLRDLGYFVGAEPESFCSHPVRFDPRYSGPRRGTPGVDATTGSLGHGVGLGVGWALADRLAGRDNRTFVLIGDGDLFEGSTFEAMRMAVGMELSNLYVLVDMNGASACKTTPLMFPSELHSFMYEAGWYTEVGFGNSTSEIYGRMIRMPDKQDGRPALFGCVTRKGHGVAMMENSPLRWHHRVPNEEEYDAARKELLGE